MKIWILLNIIFIFAFMVTFAAITGAGAADGEDLHSWDSSPMVALGVPIWAMYGEFDLDWTATHSGIVGETTLWIYVLVSNVRSGHGTPTTLSPMGPPSEPYPDIYALW